MRSFVTVVRQESFAGAARALSISRALVSRHIADLEKQVGIRLVNRTTRSITLTEAGKRYSQFAQRILGEIAQVDASLAGLRDNAQGELAIVCPKWIGSLDLGDAVAAFAVEHPKIHVRLELGGMSGQTYNFVEEGFDIAFHTKPLRDSSIVVRKIAPLQFVLCASAGYLEAHDVPNSPADLSAHDSLIHVNDPVWHFACDGKKSLFKAHHVVFSSNTFLVLQKAAMRGMGIALLPLRSVYREVQDGLLVPVLPQYRVPERPLYAAFAPSRPLLRKVRVFVDFIADWFSAHPLPAKTTDERNASAPRAKSTQLIATAGQSQ
jgi:DNA-binding transcriptional LysR family regulator